MSISTQRAASRQTTHQDFSQDVRLVEVFRGSYVNNVHRGVVAVRGASGADILTLGDGHQPVFLRSAAKPFQVMPAVLSGGIDRFGVTERELAVLCASHRAEPEHMEAVLSVLGRIGLDERHLHCGVHPPLDEKTAQVRWRRGVEPTPVCNNCSGAHAGMLVACLAEGWPLESYEQADHPLQRRTLSIIAAFAGVDGSAIGVGMDNCAVPTFRIPIAAAAQAFARLGSGREVGADLAAAARRVSATMNAHPEMVGGTHSWDTALMRAARGRLLCKGGADGFQGISGMPDAVGLAIKISDGDSTVIPPAVLAVMRHLQLIDDAAVRELESYARVEIRSRGGELVGAIVPAIRFETDA
jgi:L-asparaginase II